MTDADIVDVLTGSGYNWMKLRINAMMDAVHSNGGKWLWTIGGSTDVRYAMMPDQV